MLNLIRHTCLRTIPILVLSGLSIGEVRCDEPTGTTADTGKATVAHDKAMMTSSSGLQSHSWRRDTFEGTAKRTFAADGSSLTVELDETLGGFDTAIVKKYKPVAVDEIVDDASVGGRYDIDLKVEVGFWWAGPKMGIRRPGTHGLSGNYENYIVESSSEPIEQFHKKRLERIEAKGGSYLGTQTHDGSIYRYYHIRHKDWDQYWAVREDYRDSGTVSLKPVLSKWRLAGMKNYEIRSLRLNIETSGVMNGTFTIDEPTFPDRLTDAE